MIIVSGNLVEMKEANTDYPENIDVRLLTDYNNATQTGALDLSSEDDVRYLTKFDNETKTGNCVLPPENKTAEGETYGTDGTEFTGTFTRNTISGAIVTGQDTTGIVIGE